jgi:hypothetical protein
MAGTDVQVDLACVAVCDQPLVKDVCAVLGAMFRGVAGVAVENLTVSCHGAVYYVLASFRKGSVLEVAKSDLDTIADVNPLRVSACSVLCDGDCVSIKVRVGSFDHPVTVTDVELVRVIKKRRWALF